MNDLVGILRGKCCSYDVLLWISGLTILNLQRCLPQSQDPQRHYSGL